MMATAPTVDAPAAQDSAAFEAQPTTADNDHVAVDPAINGIANYDDIENKRITSVEDQSNSADVSVSGGSDTETSRADVSKQKDGDKNHVRTASSAKKPATFKAVSVNKTFLAAKTNASSVSPKPNESPLSTSNTPPPGTAGIAAARPRLVAKTGSGSGTIPRFSAVNGGKPAAAPDPSAVWNKNRPPEPKKFTDEELKKYGIHMASRLNEADAQGQNKWADIDDDDDDWAPEAITWGDGTKTTLPHPDEHPPPPSENDPISLKSRLREQPLLSTPSISRPPEFSGSPQQKSGNLAAGKGLVLKSGAQEKPSLVAKPPPPPASVKSPWATLPPVDKASSVAIEPAQPHRPPPNYAAPTSGFPPPPKEIAADDFNRSGWRDGTAQGYRELYNSQSGKYEPVPDRRGSFRSDQQHRHPAVLQRPQHQPADHPAEPSSFFQTNRTSQDVPYRRRRASSNLSGGSGSYGQRMIRPSDGHMPPPELLGARRLSLASSGEAPLSPAIIPPAMQGSSRQPASTGWPPRASPESSFAPLRRSSQASGAATVGTTGSDLVYPQVPPSLPPQEDEIEFQKKLMREKTELARKRRLEDEAREQAERRARIQKKLDALGPAPEKKSEKKDVKDSGSKFSQIQQRQQPETASSSHPAEQVQQQPSSTEDTTAAAANKNQESDMPSGKAKSSLQVRRTSHGQEARQPDIWGAGGSRSERIASWTSAAPPSSRNVWGSPNNDRGLGNGTFNPDLGRAPPGSTVAAAPNNAPSPIGPPGPARATSQGPPQQVPQVPITSRAARYTGPNTEVANKWVSGVAENDKKMAAARAAERAERERQMAERGLTIDDVQPTIKDTWRPVQIPGDGSRRVMSSVDVQTHGRNLWTREDLAKGAQPDGGSVPSANPGIIGSTPASILSNSSQRQSSQPRPSRFFPTKEYQDPYADGEHARSGSPTPPPPTMEGHPAYEGDSMHPQVSLPKPHPVVKLPPMAGAAESRTRGDFAWARPTPFQDPSRVSQALVQALQGRSSGKPQDNWQNRINNLLNGSKGSPPKSLGVESSSKSALDHAVQDHAATVSLPAMTLSLISSHEVITKPMAEECFEEQEMGSLPQIRLPHKAPEAAWVPAQTQLKPFPKKLLVQPFSLEPYYFGLEVAGNGNTLKIHFPGMKETKSITIPFSAAKSSRGGHGRPGPRNRGSSHTSRGGKRDASSSYDGRGSPSSGRGRGGYRGRGSEKWARGSDSQGAQQSASVSS